jgi:hypothetical protein
MPGLPYDYVVRQRRRQQDQHSPVDARSPLGSQPSTSSPAASSRAYATHGKEMQVVRFLMALYPQLR